MEEVWKDIKGYEGHYQVSNLGFVVSEKYNNIKNNRKKLKKSLTHDGYETVTLYKNNKRKTLRVHRLVAEAFLFNPKNLPQVNHKDENKTNNNVHNLEWCDVIYNINYGTRNEKTRKAIIQYDKNNKFIKEWASVTDACKFYNNNSICECCKNKRKTANGYIWKYKESR